MIIHIKAVTVLQFVIASVTSASQQDQTISYFIASYKCNTYSHLKLQMYNLNKNLVYEFDLRNTFQFNFSSVYASSYKHFFVTAAIQLAIIQLASQLIISKKNSDLALFCWNTQRQRIHTFFHQLLILYNIKKYFQTWLIFAGKPRDKCKPVSLI